MSYLLDGLDDILDDDFFNELIHLDKDEYDCSPTLNQFLGIQSEEYDILLNQIFIKDFESKISNVHSGISNLYSFLYSLLVLYYGDLIEYSSENDGLSNSYMKTYIRALG